LLRELDLGEIVDGDSRGTALAGLEVRNLTRDIRGQLGLPPDTHGVVITGVPPDSTAAAAGLEEGDVIQELNRRPVRNLTDFKRLTSKLGKQDSVLLLVNRRGSKLFVVIRP